MVIRSTKGAEDVLNKYENQLRDVNKVPVNEKEIEATQTQLQVHCLSHNYPTYNYELKSNMTFMFFPSFLTLETALRSGGQASHI